MHRLGETGAMLLRAGVDLVRCRKIMQDVGPRLTSEELSDLLAPYVSFVDQVKPMGKDAQQRSTSVPGPPGTSAKGKVRQRNSPR